MIRHALRACVRCRVAADYAACAQRACARRVEVAARYARVVRLCARCAAQRRAEARAEATAWCDANSKKMRGLMPFRYVRRHHACLRPLIFDAADMLFCRAVQARVWLCSSAA